jgi:hypothetical protein
MWVFAVAVIVVMDIGFVMMPVIIVLFMLRLMVVLIMMLVVLRFTTFALQETHRPAGELLATEQTVEEGFHIRSHPEDDIRLFQGTPLRGLHAVVVGAGTGWYQC